MSEPRKKLGRAEIFGFAIALLGTVAWWRTFDLVFPDLGGAVTLTGDFLAFLTVLGAARLGVNMVERIPGARTWTQPSRVTPPRYDDPRRDDES